MEGLNVPHDVAYCAKCKRPVQGKRGMKLGQWFFHFGLIVISYGWWLILFIPYFIFKPKICPLCMNERLEGGPLGRNQ